MTPREKETISALSQVVGALSAVAVADNGSDGYRGAEVAKSAVENNLLSKFEDDIAYNLSKEFDEKGWLPENKQKQISELLAKSDEIDRLIQLNQTNPEALTESQKSYLNRELTIIAKSYNIPVSQLYSWDFSNTTARDNRELKGYLASQNAIANSFNSEVSQGVRDGLALYPGFTSISTVLSTMPKVANLAQKYPLLTDITATAVVNTGYQLAQNKPYDPYSLLH